VIDYSNHVLIAVFTRILFAWTWYCYHCEILA